MVADKEKTTTKRKKPKFLRTDWHKKIRLGRGVKKNQKWHGAKGRQNKLRLNRKGRMQRPKIGWSADAKIRGLVDGVRAVRINSIIELQKIKKGFGIIIGSVGMKKRTEIIKKADEMELKILNKYGARKDAIK